MEVLIKELEFAQGLHVNGLIAWVINEKRYKKVYIFMDINEKMWWSVLRTFLSEMKSLLPYFVKFSDDESILPKV